MGLLIRRDRPRAIACVSVIVVRASLSLVLKRRRPNLGSWQWIERGRLSELGYSDECPSILVASSAHRRSFCVMG